MAGSRARRHQPIQVTTERAIPAGLLLNELATNAFKYAYPASGGEIRVRLREPEPGSIRLEVVDHGQGLPPGFDITKPSGSLGKRLISGFSRQLGATVKVLDAHPGARFIIDIPRPSGEAASTLN